MCVIASLTAGLGVAAGDTAVSVTPQEASVDVGESTRVNVTATTVDNGIGAYNLTVETDAVVTIQNVTLAGNPGFEEVTYSDNNTSVGVRAAVTDTRNTGEVTIVSVTLQGETAGETPVEVTVTELGDEDGNPYNVTSGQAGQLTVEQDDDTGGDTGDDTGGDTGGDTGDDTGGDTGGDTGDDTGGDTGGDTGDDTGGDTGGDTGDDTGGDTGGDTVTPTETDTSSEDPDTVTPTETDTSSEDPDTVTPTETDTSSEDPDTVTPTETDTSSEDPDTATPTETDTSSEDPDTATPTETDTGIPGFSPVIALLGLCAATFLAIRRTD